MKFYGIYSRNNFTMQPTLIALEKKHVLEQKYHSKYL